MKVTIVLVVALLLLLVAAPTVMGLVLAFKASLVLGIVAVLVEPSRSGPRPELKGTHV